MIANMPLVLLAFAPADRFAADTVRNALTEAGLTCDIAPQDGAARSAIVAAASVPRALVIVHSHASVGDVAILRVAEAAAGRRLPMLVVRLDDTKPASGLRTFLRGMPSIDAAGGKLPQRVAGIVVRTKHAAGIALGDADAIDDGEGGIELWSADRHRVSRAWVVTGVILFGVIAVLAWRGYDRAAAQSAYERGVARLADGDLDAAAANLDTALARRPEWGAAWRQRGFASRDAASQIANFSRAIAIDPNDADSLAARGRAYLHDGDATHARADLSAAIARVPDNAEWFGERGLVAMLANDDAAAHSDFLQCAKLQPRCAEAFAARISTVEASQNRSPRDWFAAP